MSDQPTAKPSNRPRSVAIALTLALLGVATYSLFQHPPLEQIEPNEIGLRVNRLTGTSGLLGDGVALVLPGVHELRRYSLQDRIYRPVRSSRASGEAPLQSSEGLSIGVELSVRYALDPERIGALAGRLQNAGGEELVESLVQGVIYKQFARYTVREIFTAKREELKNAIEAELKPLMAKDGLLLRSVTMGNIDLPADYRAGMDRLLAAELQTAQMEYTLELKAKQVRETELQGEADKMRREKAAEAAANEQVIAAKAQEEAMKHVLPFKQKQIEQRKLEADADKATRVSMAQASAEARLIEAAAEADSRRKLADAEAYRIEQLGVLASTQLERDGALISRYPLLIQKTMADKLSDKISVIIAPSPADGGFIGSNLLGSVQRGRDGATAEQGSP